MLSYQHGFHAGNFADVHKHSILVLLLEALNKKAKPWSYLETHGGAAFYDLTDLQAQKTGEYQWGVEKVFQANSVPKALSGYMEQINKVNAGSGLTYYPGSPLIASQMARAEDHSAILPHYMEAVFDCCGVHIEEHRSGSFLLEPGEHMTIPFPGLVDEGSVITYSRDVALGNEDIYFLTWEHPMVIHAMDRISSQESGNAVVAAIKHKTVQPGTLLVESIFVLEASGQDTQRSNHYLPPAPIRILVDEQNSSNYAELSHESINRHWVPVATGIAKQVVQMKETEIKTMLANSERQAAAQVPERIAAARQRIRQTFLPEIERLKALRKINPNVRDDEIAFFEQQWEKLNKMLDSARLRLDAVRVIVAT